MADSTTVTVRLSSKTKGRLEKLAQTQDRTKSYIAGQAIEAYLANQEWWGKKIAAARKSRDLTDREVKQMFRELESLEGAMARKRTNRSPRNR